MRIAADLSRVDGVSPHLGLVRYLTGATLARTADAMSGPALLLLGLAVVGSTGPASLLFAGLTVASAVGGPVLGVLFDRSARPGRLLAVALCLFGLGLTVAAVTLGRWPIAVVVGLAVAAGLFVPALSGGWTAQLGDVVPERILRRAQSLDASTYNVGGLAGPGITAAVAGIWGPGWAVAASIGLLALAVPVAATLPRPSRTPLQTTVPAALRAGATAIVTIPGLRRITLASVVAFVGFGMFIVACPLLGVEHFGSTARGASLLSVMAVGALVTTVLLARWPLSVRPDTFFVIATGIATACLTTQAVAPNGVVVVVAAALLGIADGPQLAAVIAVRHREAPDGLRAQVFTTGASLKVTAGALGAALAGALASHSLTLVLLVAAGTQVLALTAFFAVRVRTPASAVDRGARPA
jgi:MFS family permease